MRPECPSRGNPVWAGSCSKAIRGCPGKAGTKSGAARPRFTAPRKRESRRVGTRRLPYVGDRVGGLGVRPPALGTSIWCLQALFARALHVHRAIIGAARTPIVVAHHPAAVVAAHAADADAADTAEYRKPPLLALVQALVERICGVHQFLQCRTRVRHGCGALTQALDRIVAGRRIAHCSDPFHPQLADLACRLLEGRPVLLLLGGQSQTRLEAGKPRLAEGPQVLRLPALGAITAAALLGVDKRRAGNRKRCCSGDDSFPHGVPSNQPDVEASTSRKQPSIKLKFC